MTEARDPHPSTTTPPRLRPGRKATLSRRLVADAAVEIGFQSLTLTAVAERLGVSHAGLYTHIRDRDDLVIAAADRVAETTTWPEPTPDWATYLDAEAWTLWHVFSAYPGMLAAVNATGRAPARVRDHFAEVCAHLVGIGFDAEHAVLATDTVFDLAADSSVRSSDLAGRGDEPRRQMVGEWATPLDPRLGAVVADAITGDPARWFAKKLAVVLAGIAATLAPGAPDSD